MGCDAFDCGQNWLYSRDVAEMGAPPERDQGLRAGLTSSDRERLTVLERENRELGRTNEILRQASAFFAQAERERRPK